MCTLAVLPQPDGDYLLVANRDELYARSEAIPPSVHDHRDVAVAHPVDPDGGGTWIAANEYGLSTTLLNHYPADPPPIDGVPLSRGQVVVAVSSAADLEGVRTVFDGEIADNLSRLRPFRLLAVERGDGGEARGIRLSWDRRDLDVDEITLPFADTTSALRTREVSRRRLEILAPLLQRNHPVDIAETMPFFRSHEPNRESSICVHREHSGTISHTAISVGPGEVTLRYVDAPLCVGGDEYTVTLPAGRGRGEASP